MAKIDRDFIGGIICRVFGHRPTTITIPTPDEEEIQVGQICFRCGAGEIFDVLRDQ